MDVLDKFFIKYSYKFPKGYPDLKDKQDILLLESILEELNVGVKLNEAGLVKSKMVDNPNRAKAFKNRFDKNLPFELVGGDDVVLDKEKSNFNFNTFDGVLVGDDGKKYPLSKFEKTEEFGGKENITAKSEAIQAIAVAIRFKKGSDIEIEDINISNVNDVTEEGLTSIKDKNTKEDLVNWYQDPKNKSWATSTINTSNVIANSSFIDDSKQYYTFWQDSFVDAIYRTFNKIKSLSLKSDIISVVSDDKWNPSDMFISTDEGFSKLRGIIEQIDFENIQEFNGIINDLFCGKEVLGISLKKSEKGLPQIKEFNQEACKTRSSIGTIGDLEFKEYVISPKGGGIEIHALDKKGDTLKLALRNFAGKKGFSGELKGTEAAGGKVGIAAINTYLNNKNLIPSSPSEVEKNLIPKEGKPTKAYIDKFKGLWDEHIGTDFNSWFNQAEDKHKTSRYFALHVVDALEKTSNRDKLLTDLFQYGGSSIKDISSTFAKSGK